MNKIKSENEIVQLLQLTDLNYNLNEFEENTNNF